MRLFAVLAIVFVALVVATVRQATSWRGRAAATATPPTPEVEDGVADDAPPARRSPRLPYVAPAASDEGARGGVAHLHGRVLPAPGRSADTLDNTKTVVVADNGVRSFRVYAIDDGRFSLHLPPGRYELIASADQWSGFVSNVVAHGDTDRAIDIQLQEAATISGVLHGGIPGDVGIIARFAGRATELRVADISDQHFEITGLLSGRHYDLEIYSSHARTVNLRDVTASARDLDIQLVPFPVLRGAFGFPRGGECPIEMVAVTLSPDRDGDKDENVGHDCRFEIMLRVAEASVQVATVAATGAGWHVEQTITIPARGDPDPVCLNPPCLANPFEGSARMLVTMEGHDNSFTTVHATTKDGPGSDANCTGGACVLEPLTPNRNYQVTASAAGCQEEVRDVAVTAGDNTLRFTCRRQRKVQGLLRAAGAPPSVEVRCTGGVRNVRQSRLFAITCAVDDMALQYRVLPDGVWHSAAIPTDEDLPLVEIAL